MANEKKESFDELCNRYRRMMQDNSGKSHKERLDAINRFRCGEEVIPNRLWHI